MYAASNISSIAQAEFQLIEDKHGFIVGRVFIPSGVKGSVKGTLIRKMERPKFTVIEFIPRNLAEVERCIKQYAASNIAFNRVRTIGLLQQLRKGRSICPPPELSLVEIQVPTTKATTTTKATAADVAADSNVVTLSIAPEPITPPSDDIEEVCKISMAELDPEGDLKSSYCESPVVFLEALNNLSLRELKATAKEQGLKGISKFKKAQLVSLLTNLATA